MQVLDHYASEKILSRYVSFPKSVMTTTPIQGIAATKKTGLPCFIKLISPQAIHKTEGGWVRIANNLEELRHEYSDMMKAAMKKKMKLDGVLVQEMAKGREVIIGIKKDPTFGHVIVFGMGGKYVEVIKDVSMRVCPIDEKEAGRMIEELKYKKILEGARGEKPVNMRLLKKTLAAISRLPVKSKNVQEMDINPFIINEKTGKAVDARIVMN